MIEKMEWEVGKMSKKGPVVATGYKCLSPTRLGWQPRNACLNSEGLEGKKGKIVIQGLPLTTQNWGPYINEPWSIGIR